MDQIFERNTKYTKPAEGCHSLKKNPIYTSGYNCIGLSVNHTTAGITSPKMDDRKRNNLTLVTMGQASRENLLLAINLSTYH